VITFCGIYSNVNLCHPSLKQISNFAGEQEHKVLGTLFLEEPLCCLHLVEEWQFNQTNTENAIYEPSREHRQYATSSQVSD